MMGVKVLLVLLSTVVAQSSARKLAQIMIAPAQAAPTTILTNQTVQGITGFLQSNANYSTFLSLIQSDPVYSVLLSGEWSTGVTNNTVLVPTNDAITAGFKTLAEKYNASANPGQYLYLANQSGLGQNFVETPLNTALAQLFAAILNSHIFTTPINVYADTEALTATATAPLVLPSSGLGSDYSTVVYNNGTADDARLKFAQPSGLLANTLSVPEIYAQQKGTSTLGVPTVLYLYEVSSMFVASQVLRAAADGGATVDAIQEIMRYIVQ